MHGATRLRREILQERWNTWWSNHGLHSHAARGGGYDWQSSRYAVRRAPRLGHVSDAHRILGNVDDRGGGFAIEGDQAEEFVVDHRRANTLRHPCNGLHLLHLQC